VFLEHKKQGREKLMMDNKVILTFVACIAIIIIFGKYFAFPIKKIAKLIGNSVLGALIIFIINLVRNFI